MVIVTSSFNQLSINIYFRIFCLQFNNRVVATVVSEPILGNCGLILQPYNQQFDCSCTSPYFHRALLSPPYRLLHLPILFCVVLLPSNFRTVSRTFLRRTINCLLRTTLYCTSVGLRTVCCNSLPSGPLHVPPISRYFF